MPYTNGTFSLYTPGNPVVTGTVIASTWANNTLNDIASALTTLGQSSTTGLTATGTNQSTALEITSNANLVSTVASGTGVRLSSTASVGQEQWVYNSGANPLAIYPPSSGNINDLAANAKTILSTNTTMVFKKLSTTQWVGMLSY